MVAITGTILAGIGGALTAGVATGGAAIAIGGVAAAGAVAGVVGTVKAGKATRKAAAAQQKAQELQAKRQRRAAIRSNILASARARASAQSAGTAQSSGLSGAIGAGRSQLGAELGFGTQMSGLSANISKFNMQAQTYGDIAKLGFAAAGNASMIGQAGYDGYQAWKT